MSRQKKKALTPQKEKDFALSLDADKEIFPYLPALLKDLWELGCVPSLYVKMLRPLQLPRETTRALDLGTGKGAAAVVLARELGFRVLGIDLCVPFLEEAEKRARLSGVSHLCRFVPEDAHRTVQKARGFDLVLLFLSEDFSGIFGFVSAN